MFESPQNFHKAENNSGKKSCLNAQTALNVYISASGKRDKWKKLLKKSNAKEKTERGLLETYQTNSIFFA